MFCDIFRETAGECPARRCRGRSVQATFLIFTGSFTKELIAVLAKKSARCCLALDLATLLPRVRPVTEDYAAEVMGNILHSGSAETLSRLLHNILAQRVRECPHPRPRSLLRHPVPLSDRVPGHRIRCRRQSGVDKKIRTTACHKVKGP